jgi:hypothetical protein
LDDGEEEYKVLALVPGIELAEGVCYGWHLDAAEYSVQMYKCTNTESLSCLFVAPRTTWNGHDPGSSDSCLDAVREARLGGCPWVGVCTASVGKVGKVGGATARLGPPCFKNRPSRSAAAPVLHRFLVPLMSRSMLILGL